MPRQTKTAIDPSTILSDGVYAFDGKDRKANAGYKLAEGETVIAGDAWLRRKLLPGETPPARVRILVIEG